MKNLWSIYFLFMLKQDMKILQEGYFGTDFGTRTSYANFSLKMILKQNFGQGEAL